MHLLALTCLIALIGLSCGQKPRFETTGKRSPVAGKVVAADDGILTIEDGSVELSTPEPTEELHPEPGMSLDCQALAVGEAETEIGCFLLGEAETETPLDAADVRWTVGETEGAARFRFFSVANDALGAAQAQAWVLTLDDEGEEEPVFGGVFQLSDTLTEDRPTDAAGAALSLTPQQVDQIYWNEAPSFIINTVAGCGVDVNRADIRAFVDTMYHQHYAPRYKIARNNGLNPGPAHEAARTQVRQTVQSLCPNLRGEPSPAPAPGPGPAGGKPTPAQVDAHGFATAAQFVTDVLVQYCGMNPATPNTVWINDLVNVHYVAHYRQKRKEGLMPGPAHAQTRTLMTASLKQQCAAPKPPKKKNFAPQQVSANYQADKPRFLADAAASYCGKGDDAAYLSTLSQTYDAHLAERRAAGDAPGPAHAKARKHVVQTLKSGC